MAGLCFQWLKSDLSVGQAEELRTGELILLRVCVHVRVLQVQHKYQICILIAEYLLLSADTLLDIAEGVLPPYGW